MCDAPPKTSSRGKFLIEMLSVMSTDEISIRLSTPNRAGILTPAEEIKGQDLLMLIMPVLINQGH